MKLPGGFKKTAKNWNGIIETSSKLLLSKSACYHVIYIVIYGLEDNKKFRCTKKRLHHSAKYDPLNMKIMILNEVC